MISYLFQVDTVRILLCIYEDC